jgi:hypothetical protein
MSKSKKSAGEMRQSQVLSTFGPGSMMDLPNHAVLMGGLNHWQGYQNQPIYEDRLAQQLAEILGVTKVSMYAPPTSETDPAAKRTGIKAFVFPLWFVAQESQPSKFAGRDYQTRAILPYNRLVNGCYLNDLNKKVSVVPIRFVQACPNGHISDIDWYKFVNKDCRSNCRAQLYLDEGGTGNNFADIFVRCDKCKKRRPLGDAIQEWLTRSAVKDRGKELLAGFQQWLTRRGLNPDEVNFPGLPYIMLHSLSHLLITSISLECGYAASSIRERIYAGEYGYGILLYTGSSSSEGTLGGLVQVGDRIEHHLAAALEYGKLCSNDPVCSQDKPENAQVERFLHGSACHSCLLIAEPSCERRNEFLDRDLVVNTLNSSGAAFFPDVVS